MRSLDLRAQRAKLIEDARAVIDTDTPHAEDLAKFDEMMDAADRMKQQIDRIEKAQALSAEMGEVIGASAEKHRISRDEEEDGLVREKRVITNLLRVGVNGMKGKDREYVEQRMVQAAAMNTGTNSAGGYTIAPLFFNELQVAMKAQGGMRAVSRVITTDTGASLPFPTLDDRSNAASIISENSQITEDTELTFGQQTLGGYTYKSGVCLVSLQLLNDSAFDFDSVIRDAIAGRFVRGQNAHFTTGTGSSQPNGVVPKASAGKTGATGQTTSIVYNDIVDMIHAVDPVYRPGSSWMMHDSSLKAFRKLVDSQGHPLWQAGLVDGAPDRLMGYPVVTNQDVATMAANAKSVLFGNFQNYFIRDIAPSMQMMVLRERYADYLQVGYIAFLRSDGNLISAASPIVVYSNSAT